MVKRRIIPVILLKNGMIVQSRNFNRYQPIGTPTVSVERYSNWESDELIYLDISKISQYDISRNDINHPLFTTIIDILKMVSEKCFMPLTVGGGIRSMDDVELRLKNGADKIALNTNAIENIDFISDTASKYGSQCVVVSIDVKKIGDNSYKVVKNGKDITDLDPKEFAYLCQESGAGEILLNSVDRDGSGLGFDVDLINYVCNGLTLPLIAVGGAGNWEHFEHVLNNTNVSAVAAANIFQHSENSVFNCRKFLYEAGCNIRPPSKLSETNKNL